MAFRDFFERGSSLFGFIGHALQEKGRAAGAAEGA